MRLAVLCASDSWYFRDLRRAAPRDWSLDSIAFGNLRSEVCQGTLHVAAGPETLKQFDAVLVRTMPPGSLEQIVFRMDALSAVDSQGIVVLNRPRSLEAAVDKYLATVRLAEAGLATPRTVVCQTAGDALKAFAEMGNDVVVKPLFGGEGRGLMRISSEEMALRAFKTLQQLQAAIYIQQFVPHRGYDIRLFVAGDRVLGMRRVNSGDWRTNISRGAHGEPLEVDELHRDVARRAAAAVGASLAGVDILPSREGEPLVLEVNAVPGWKALSKVLQVDVAQVVLNHVRDLVKERSDGMG
jgi:ribosomal protein S6--L-glutamate ligase